MMRLDSEEQRQLLQKVIGATKIDGTFADQAGNMQILSNLLQVVQQAPLENAPAGQQPPGAPKLLKKEVKKKKEGASEEKNVSY